jgi:transcriptional regulator with XRE-family HTH domain
MPAGASSSSCAVARPHPLRVLRERRGLSLRQLGARAKVNFRKLSLLECGPTRDERRRLARTLRVAVTALD